MARDERTDERTDGRTNEGVLRGPRGTKKDDLEVEADEEVENARQDKCVKKLTRAEEKMRREERRVAREVRRKRTKENKLKKEKKVKLAKEKLENEGKKRNKNQLVLLDWLKGGSMKLPDQDGHWGGKKQGKTKKGIG